MRQTTLYHLVQDTTDVLVSPNVTISNTLVRSGADCKIRDGFGIVPLRVAENQFDGGSTKFLVELVIFHQCKLLECARTGSCLCVLGVGYR